VEVNYTNIDCTKFLYLLVSFDDRRVVANAHACEERD